MNGYEMHGIVEGTRVYTVARVVSGNLDSIREYPAEWKPFATPERLTGLLCDTESGILSAIDLSYSGNPWLVISAHDTVSKDTAEGVLEYLMNRSHLAAIPEGTQGVDKAIEPAKKFHEMIY